MEIENPATVTVERDTLSDNGAATIDSGAMCGRVHQAADHRLQHLVSDNTGYNGGALDTSGPTTIVNGTFVGNDERRSTRNGDGGAMQVSNATLVNDTITGNECFNGSGCGGAIFGTATAADTIIAGNIEYQGLATDNCETALTAAGPDLENGASCGFASHGGINGTPLLGRCGTERRPTNTLLPGSGSPAIGAGTNATCATLDQRGGARPGPLARPNATSAPWRWTRSSTRRSPWRCRRRRLPRVASSCTR